ncbi:MAG: hypothetical protein NTZ33_07745 [Bacteroidetes bacterium]|nr:hypothetical protein [Bacteroidota bacterium]
MNNSKKQYFWAILLFGTLIGINESLIGSLDIHNKSVILSTITIALLAFARYHFPKAASSILIIAIAVLFKMNNTGIYFCKPLMVIMLGLSFELFASILVKKGKLSLLSFALTSAFTAILAFSVFAVFETFIMKSDIWNINRFNTYVFIKAPITAVTTALLSIAGIYGFKKWKINAFQQFFNKPVLAQFLLGFGILLIWAASCIAFQN